MSVSCDHRAETGMFWDGIFCYLYFVGGAGEGKQRLRPDGAIQNQKQVKTDAVLPAYCNPANPCPVGYTADDGCLENFENTAAFSREYQAAQDCMCDAEHMFDCSASNNNGGSSSSGRDATPATPNGGSRGSGEHNELLDAEADIERLVREYQVRCNFERPNFSPLVFNLSSRSRAGKHSRHLVCLMLSNEVLDHFFLIKIAVRKS